MASSNMYRVGDYVYFENSSSNPYLIRRIEELNKTPSGNVEAKVICFYRRRDISNSLLLLADKHAKDMEEDMDEECTNLNDVERHQLNHRELYLSRQLDTLPATHIRGKCSVTLLNETEDLKSYLTRGDTFFYSLVYDPALKTLLADKGEIRVGSRYQAEVPDKLLEDTNDSRDLETLEELTWQPDNHLTEKQVEQFLIVSRSVGTFARALDCSSSVRQPSLHMSAAAASRDITLFHAMDTLHKTGYDLAKSMTSLITDKGPVLCRDEMEDWSSSEANLFEEALEKYGKDFNDIRQDFLPWKSLPSIVEYYYMWKTSDRYIQQKRQKAVDAESKLKQVYIPNYNKPNPNQIKMANGDNSGKACEGCFCLNSFQWYTWGPPNMSCRLCATCWSYWKKYGGLKMPPSSRLERFQNHKIKGTDKELRYRPPSAASMPGLIGNRTQRSSHKTKQSFCLNATKLTRLARRLCSDILSVRHFSRHPFDPISVTAMKAECQIRLSSNPQYKSKVVPKNWPPLQDVLEKIRSLPPKISKPSASKADLTSGKAEGKVVPRNNHHVMLPMKRPHQNGIDNAVSSGTNGSFYRMANGPQKKKRCVGNSDPAEDTVFVCTPKIREMRKQLKISEQRSAARRPNKSLISANVDKLLSSYGILSARRPGQPIVIDD